MAALGCAVPALPWAPRSIPAHSLLWVQVWMCPHPPKRGVICMGTCPKVHTGFYKAWTANGLHTEVIQYLQVPPQPNVQGCAASAAVSRVT